MANDDVCVAGANSLPVACRWGYLVWLGSTVGRMRFSRAAGYLDTHKQEPNNTNRSG